METVSNHAESKHLKTRSCLDQPLREGWVVRQRALQDSHDLGMLRRHAVPLRQARERHRGGLEAQVGETEGVWGQARPCGDQHALECHLQGAGSWLHGVTVH